MMATSSPITTSELNDNDNEFLSEMLRDIEAYAEEELEAGSDGEETESDKGTYPDPQIEIYDHYHLRVHSREKFQQRDFYDYMKNNTLYLKFIGGTEKKGTPEEHYHFDVAVDKFKTTKRDIHDDIYMFMLDYWKNPETGRMCKGYGNSQFYCKKAEKLDSNTSYSVKDTTDILHKGYTDDEVLYIISQSYPKV